MTNIIKLVEEDPDAIIKLKDFSSGPDDKRSYRLSILREVDPKTAKLLESITRKTDNVAEPAIDLQNKYRLRKKEG